MFSCFRGQRGGYAGVFGIAGANVALEGTREREAAFEGSFAGETGRDDWRDSGPKRAFF